MFLHRIHIRAKVVQQDFVTKILQIVLRVYAKYVIQVIIKMK